MELRHILTELTAIEHAGYPRPARIAAILATYNAVVETDADRAATLEAVGTAIGAGDTPAALAAADRYAVLITTPREQIFSYIDATVADGLLAAWPTEHAWTHAADRYGFAARAFTAAVRAVDPDADPAAVMSLSKSAREAWANMPTLARDLEAAIVMFAAAATLADKGFDSRNTTHLLGLVTNASPGELTDYLEVLDGNLAPGHFGGTVEVAGRVDHGRAGKWGELIRRGATLRAASLKGFTPLLVVDVAQPTPEADHWTGVEYL